MQQERADATNRHRITASASEAAAGRERAAAAAAVEAAVGRERAAVAAAVATTEVAGRERTRRVAAEAQRCVCV